jgi:hypothetical protein
MFNHAAAVNTCLFVLVLRNSLRHLDAHRLLYNVVVFPSAALHRRSERVLRRRRRRLLMLHPHHAHHELRGSFLLLCTCSSPSLINSYCRWAHLRAYSSSRYLIRFQKYRRKYMTGVLIPSSTTACSVHLWYRLMSDGPLSPAAKNEAVALATAREMLRRMAGRALAATCSNMAV